MREVQASVGQRLLWLMDHYRGEQGSLSEQILWRMPEPPDLPALVAALAVLVERHEILHTTFVETKRQLYQVIQASRPPELVTVDLCAEPEPERSLRRALTADLNTTIDPGVWPVRATLYRLGGGTHLLCLSLHHLVTDDWSNSLLSRELRYIYSVPAGEPLDLPPIAWQYAQWAQWQRELLGGPGLERLLDFWRKQLAGSALPALRRRETGRPPVRRFAESNLSDETVEALRALARTYHTTFFVVMLSVYYVLLLGRTGQSDLTVASLFANRSRGEVQRTVGFFVNMVALRARVDDAAPFTDLVRQVRGTTITALQHQDLPYQMLPPKTIASVTGRPDDVMFQLVETTRADVADGEDDALEPQIERSRFDLELALVPMNGHLVALLMYNDHIFDGDQAQEFTAAYAALADRIVADPALPVRTVLASSSTAPAALG